MTFFENKNINHCISISYINNFYININQKPPTKNHFSTYFFQKIGVASTNVISNPNKQRKKSFDILYSTNRNQLSQLPYTIITTSAASQTKDSIPNQLNFPNHLKSLYAPNRNTLFF